MSLASDYKNGRTVGRMAVTGRMHQQVPGPGWWLGYLSAWTDWWVEPWLPR